jgi:hypothetical protein
MSITGAVLDFSKPVGLCQEIHRVSEGVSIRAVLCPYNYGPMYRSSLHS